MKSAVRVVFLLFYVASSYAITQERTALTTENLQRSISDSLKTEIGESGPQTPSASPEFRQAKPRPAADHFFGFGEAVRLLPPEAAFGSTVVLEVLDSRSTYLAGLPSRAPPLQS